MRYLLFILIVGLFTMVGCEKDNAIIDDNLDQQDLVVTRSVDRPFKAIGYGLDGEVQGIMNCMQPAFERAVDGHGNGTHIGNYTAVITECFNPETFMSVGVARIFAANGDMLYQNFEVQYYQEPGDPPNVVHGVFNYWWFDGTQSTGKFAGASGNGTGTLLGDLAAGQYYWDVEGVISY